MASRTACVVFLLAGLLAGCSRQSPTTPSPTVPAEYVQNAPWRSVNLPGGGEARLRIIEYMPARGAKLVPGAGAYLRVEYGVTSGDHLLLTVGAAAWDGQADQPTSFWSGGGGSTSFVCAPGGYSRTAILGWESSSRTQYPTGSDPAVPFVRLRFWVVPFAEACAPPTTFTLDPGAPVLDIVEPLNWARP